MATLVYIEPSTFVDWLTSPGISVGDFAVPVNRYMSGNPAFGGNAAANEILGPLQRLKGADGVAIVNQTINYARLMMGQGYRYDIALVMQFIADNLEQVRKIKGADKYFAKPDNAASVLRRMVEGGVFGLDCIGFVSQFLVSAGIWNEYKPYYPRDYFREFAPISTLEEVGPLTLLVWGNHIAIVDRTAGIVTQGGQKLLKLDICQSSDSSSAHGPQRNTGVTVTLAGTQAEGRTQFKPVSTGSPPMPVTAPFWMANYKMDTLVPARQALGL